MLGVWLRKHLVILILLFLCIIGALLVYRIHYYFDDYRYSGENCSACPKEPIIYPFPLHGDEWTHLAQGIYIIEEHKLPKVNPYVGWKHHDLEPGFNVLIAQFYILTGLDPLFNHQFLPMIFMIVYTIILFAFISKITNNHYIGLLAIPFFFAIKNNINILGVWFFVPMTLGLLLIWSFAYLFASKHYAFSALVFITAIFTYPLAAVIIAITATCYIVFEHNSFIVRKARWYYIMGAFIILLIGVVLLINIPWLQENVIFKEGWTKGFEKIYNIFEIYGIIGTITAIIGAIIAVYKKYNKVLLIMPAIFVLNTIFFMIFKFTILIPYQRGLFYMFISMVPLSAIGLYYIIRKIYESIRNKKLAIVSVSLIILLMLIFSFYDYYTIRDVRFKIYHFVTQDDYDALKWIEKNYGRDNYIIVPWDASFGVYPISRNKVIAMPESSLKAGKINEVATFYKSNDCVFKQNFKYASSKSVKINIVYSRTKIDCQYFKEVWSDKGFVYYR